MLFSDPLCEDADELYRKMNYEVYYNPGVGAYECDQCDRTYMKRGSLYTHKKFECGKQPSFYCKLCDYRSKLKGTLKRHLKQKHKISNFDGFKV